MEKPEKPGTLATFNKRLSNWVGDVFLSIEPLWSPDVLL